MKLRNKKSGAIYKIEDIDLGNNADGIWIGMTKYNSLAELTEEWEDYEETKEYWYVGDRGAVFCEKIEEYGHIWDEARREIGNYFETEEEAEKAVEKLKAWKRLKEANIDYKVSREYDDFTETMHANVSFSFNSYPLVGKDLWLLFGGENE